MVRIKDIRIVSFIWTVILFIFAGFVINDYFIFAMLIICCSSLLFLVASIIPNKLVGTYKRWIKLGEFIGGITSLVVMFLLFFGLFTPISLMFKVFGKDSLNKTIDRSIDTYWVLRTRQPESMKNQF